MKPYIYTRFGSIPTFVVMITAGILLMTFAIHIILRKSNKREYEELYITYKLVISFVIAFFVAGFFDAVFKIRENGTLEFSGITYYGGLIGAVISLYIMLKLSTDKTQYTIKEWFDNLTVPLIIFHIMGRIGCFLAGCCYGKTTESFLGVYFPDNLENGIFHHGLKCYPTQLFEAAALIIILFAVLKSQRKFELYLIFYTAARFFIEFFRGDDRGYFVQCLSPAQVISILIFILIVTNKVIRVPIARLAAAQAKINEK